MSIMLKQNRLHRREFIIKISSVSAVIAAGGILSACGGDGIPILFNYGVASGDPLSDRVMLWTHAVYDGLAADVELNWELSTDAQFLASNVVSRGTVAARTSAGNTAKVDATGLTAGTEYFYRFSSGRFRSPVGRTRTLPAAGASQVKLAVFSCSSYAHGHFNVYGAAASSDAQFAIHLGDYIYEYKDGEYPNTPINGRNVQPAKEITTLADYRTRHAQQKSDPNAKALHARMPVIAVWDDHEIANDAYMTGAENHTEGTEGTWAARKAAAIQAYHEWMPIRTGADPSVIYRSFNFGNLLALHMLDTRLIGREKQLSLAELGTVAVRAQWTSPARQLIGAAQLSWLATQMATSTAKWQVLGQQVVMARTWLPVSVQGKFQSYFTAAANPATTQAQLAAAVTDIIAEVNTYKAAYAQAGASIAAYLAGGASSSPYLDGSVNPAIPYNMDAWDGYLAARETVYGAFQQAASSTPNKKLVVLSGDTHNAWHNQLINQAGVKVGEEFATSSVTSPGWESYFPPAFFGDTLKSLLESTTAVSSVQWTDTSRRGYLKMTFTQNEAKGEFIFVDSVSSTTYALTPPAASETRTYSPGNS